jgi:OOP family OmpA-OmpF porin
MHLRTGLVLVVCAALLAGCAGQAKKDVMAAKNAGESGSAFTRELHKEYTVFAERELAEANPESASYFAKKGSSAAAGTKISPEELPAKLNYDEAALRDARPKLINALNSPQAAKRPDLAAKAQVNFDCWVQEAAEIWWQPEDRKFCQTNYEAAMADLSGVQVAKPAPVPAPVATPQPQQFLVFFEFDSSKLTPDAMEIVRSVAEAAINQSGSSIMLTGYADRAGSDAYNLALSGRRADQVKSDLVNLGISRDAISTEAKGEADPLVPTADGVAEPQNRRVEINLR